MKYVGIWWAMHLDQADAGTPARSTARRPQTRSAMIDFAAKNGFGGVLVEGWNKGWDDGDWWFGRARSSASPKPIPTSISPRSPATLGRKALALIGHHETAGNIANYEKQLGPALDLYQRLGIHAVKTGYVADAGGIQALGARRQDPLRMARRPGDGEPSSEGRHRGGETAHRSQPARAGQGHGPSPHLPQLGLARGPARDGI